MSKHEGVEKKLEEHRAKGILHRKLDKAALVTRLTLADYVYALEQSYGIVGKAAKMLGIKTEVLQRKIESTPSLMNLPRILKQERIDEAEYQLAKQVEEGVLPAITYTLSRLAKDRGYVEKAEIQHNVDPGVVRDAASLIEAMRRGVETAKALEESKTIESVDYTCVEVPVESPALTS